MQSDPQPSNRNHVVTERGACIGKWRAVTRNESVPEGPRCPTGPAALWAPWHSSETSDQAGPAGSSDSPCENMECCTGDDDQLVALRRTFVQYRNPQGKWRPNPATGVLEARRNDVPALVVEHIDQRTKWPRSDEEGQSLLRQGNSTFTSSAINQHRLLIALRVSNFELQ